MDVAVTPAGGAGGFVYALGQFFRDDKVTVSASASSRCGSLSSNPLRYQWTITARPPGSNATLSSSSSPNPSFVADVAGGTYQVSVVVRDSLGNASAPKFVTITSGSCGANPVDVSISDTAPGKPFDPHSLSASASSSDDDTPTCPTRFQQSYSYAWSVVSGPDGGGFSDSTVSSPTFTPSAPGTYVVQVVALGQGSGLSGTAQTVIDASCVAPTITQTSITELNGAPYGGQQILTGDGVTLGATATSACTTAPSFKYQWQLTSPPGSSAALSSAAASSPGFTPDVAGTYRVSLVVTDSSGLSSAPRALNFTASVCGAAPQVGSVQVSVTPADGAGGFVYGPGQFFEGDTVGLGASASSSCLAAPSLSYAWTLTARPAGSNASLSSSSSPTPSFVADVAGGSWQVRVVATDSLGNASAPAFVTVTAGSCGANPVNVSISDTPPSNPMDPHTLSATASSVDDDGALCPIRFAQSYSFAWSVVSGPGGGVFSDASVSSPTFTPSLPGAYTLEVVAVGQASGVSGTAQTVIDTTCAAPTITQTSITELNGAPYGGQQVLTGDGVTLGATATSACTTAPPSFTYEWHLLSRPNGSTAALSSTTAATPTFTPDVVGTYQFAVAVTDQWGRSSNPSTLQVTAAPR